MTSIHEAIEQYLESVAAARSPRTARSYRNGMEHFQAALAQAKIDPQTTEVTRLSEDRITLFIKHLEQLSPASQALYLTAVRGFYHFLAAERLADPNLPRLQNLVRRRARKQGRRIPQFPRAEIEQLIEYAERLSAKNVVPTPPPQGTNPTRETGRSDRQRARLRNLRDRALILFLADTGLRVSEACSLTLGDVDFHEARLTVIGKGDQQALVRISQRALAALNDYLAERKGSQPAPGQKSKSQPLFTRHDRGVSSSGRGAKGELRPLDSSSAWDIVKVRAKEAVGETAAAQIHPHSFRHYFVTVVLLATNNLEKTRRLARHKSITVTQRYAEIDPELDQDYYEIFDAGEKGKSRRGK